MTVQEYISAYISSHISWSRTSSEMTIPRLRRHKKLRRNKKIKWMKTTTQNFVPRAVTSKKQPKASGTMYIPLWFTTVVITDYGLLTSPQVLFLYNLSLLTRPFLQFYGTYFDWLRTVFPHFSLLKSPTHLISFVYSTGICIACYNLTPPACKLKKKNYKCYVLENKT